MINTAEMWINAQKDGKTYECFGGDIAYSKEHGLVNKHDFSPWTLGAWECKKEKGLDSLMNCQWVEMNNIMTIKEAERKFGIRIVNV